MEQLQPAGPLDLVERFAAERTALLQFLGGLSPSEWDAPTECPAWTVKCIALHLLGDDLSLLARQRDDEAPGVAIEPGASFDDLFVALDRFNEQWVAAAGFFSVPLLLELLRLSGEWTHAWYAAVDADRVGEAVAWVGPDPAPYWLLCAREYYERWIHHSQMRRAVGLDSLSSPEWVHPAVAVAMRGFPLGFAALPADGPMTVTIEIDGGPAWTVRHDDDAWRLYDGAPEQPTVLLPVDTDTAALVFSRALASGELATQLRPVGDHDLGALLVAGLGAFFGR